jgi:hypothetical protein
MDMLLLDRMAKSMKSRGMRIAGGILALVASVGGTIAALFTVLFGAVGKAAGHYTAEHSSGSATEYIQAGRIAEQSLTVMNLGWLGILASFLALVLAIVILCSKSQTSAWILLLCSIFGIVLGGSFVAFFMVLAVLGAIFALIGGRRAPTLTTDQSSNSL